MCIKVEKKGGITMKQYIKYIILFIILVFIGIIGIFCVSINYPIYKKILETNKKKYAYDII